MHVNSGISYTGLVEKYIGTAYDKMTVLYDNLEALLHLGSVTTSDNLRCERRQRVVNGDC